MNNGQNDFDELKIIWEQIKRNFLNKNKSVLVIVAIVVAIGAASSSFYTVNPEEEAVIIRFGKYLGTYSPGLHFKLPLGIDRLIKVKTTRVHQEEFGFRTKDTQRRRSTYSSSNFADESLMLTGDLNVAEVEWVVHYKISDPYKYLFQARNPIRNIRDVSQSIMRRVIGDQLVTDVLTTGRAVIAIEAKKLTQEVLDKYDIGINIVAVKLQDVNPPDVVRPSFNEVNEAKQEQEKLINQAERAYNEIIPEARGKAEEVISRAEGFATAAINHAKGDAGKFTSVLREYKKAPNVTRSRIYLETMETLYKKFTKLVIVDSKVKGLLPVFGKSLTQQEQ